ATPIAERVMTLVGHPELSDEPWFATGAGRAEHGDLLDGYVAEWIGARRADDVRAAFAAAGAAIGDVYSPADVVADPQVQHREMRTRIADEDLGSLLQHNVLFRMSETPGRIRFTGRAHGADTREVLHGLYGIDDARIDDLSSRG